MSQANHHTTPGTQQNPKHKRHRTTSQQGQHTPQGSQGNNNNSPWKNEQGGAGGGNGRKNKSHYYHNSGTRVFHSSQVNRTELQSLLNNLPSSTNNQQVFDHQGKGKRRGTPGEGGGTPKSIPNSAKNPPGGGVDNGSLVDDEESNRLNSAALRRIDTAFTKLHGTASQVAVYRYNASTQSWDKTDTVGCLFLYERNVSPKFGLVIMNRKNVNNFIQCFGPDGQVVLHTPYLLLRGAEELNNDPADGTQAIHCIWFYDNQECLASASILQKMGLKFEGELNEGQGFDGQAGGGKAAAQLAGNALFQILQHGKKESPQQKAKPKVMTAEELESQMLDEPQNVKKEEPKVANGQHQQSPATTSKGSPGGSVLHQFLNMSLKEKSVTDGNATSTDGVTSVSRSTVARALGTQNQMRTVEQLEREMTMDRSTENPVSAVAIQTELMHTLGIPNIGVGNKTDFNPVQSAGATASPSRTSTKSIERVLLDNIIGKSVDETDPEHLRQVLQSIEPSNLILVTETVPGANETRLTWRINRSSSLRKENDSMFTTPTGEYVSASGTRCSSQVGVEARYFEGSYRPVEMKPSPLTKDQLSQALVYLLQNDGDFVKKIHDAYVMSLQQAFENR